MKNSEILAAFILVNEKMIAGVPYLSLSGLTTYSPYICDNIGQLFEYRSDEYNCLTSIVKKRIKGRYCVKSYLKECLGWGYDQIDHESLRHYRLGMLKEFINEYRKARLK